MIVIGILINWFSVCVRIFVVGKCGELVFYK